MRRRKRRRMVLLLSGMAALGAAALLMGFAFRDSIVFFYSPSEVMERGVEAGRRIRLGGLVQQDSVVRDRDGLTVAFRVTDLAETVPVLYRGLLPDLFREGQGVVAEGAFDAGGRFVASQVLAKHDEAYMPREVAEALKKTGEWRGAGKTAE